MDFFFIFDENNKNLSFLVFRRGKEMQMKNVMKKIKQKSKTSRKSFILIQLITVCLESWNYVESYQI